MKKKKKNYFYLIFVVSLALIFLVFVIYMLLVIPHLESEIMSSLETVARQSAVSLSEEINGRYSLLEGIAAEIQFGSEEDDEILRGMRNFLEPSSFSCMGYLHEDGSGTATDGTVADLSGSRFFQRGIAGEKCLTDGEESGLSTDKNVVSVFSVPVYGRDKAAVQGVVYAVLENKNFGNVVNADFFDSEGFSCIIRDNGDVVLHSSNSLLQAEKNLLEYMHDKQPTQDEAAGNVQAVMLSEDGGSGECETPDSLSLYCYVPLSGTADGDHWYVVAFAELSTVMGIMVPVFRLVEGMALTVLLITALGVGIYIYINRIHKKDLIWIAYHDQLTGLFNRTAYTNYTADKEFTPMDCIVAAFDLNDLKKCNDTLGHEKGDLYIRECADMIKTVFGDVGNCYRMGGDEFCALVYNMTPSQCERRMQTLQDMVTERNARYPEMDMGITCGYEMYDESVDCDINDTLKRADQMMYREKFARKHMYT